MNRDHAGQPVPLFPAPGSLEPMVMRAEMVPADDGVLDEPVAAFGNLLFDLVGTFETARLSGGDGPCGTGHETALSVQV